MIIALSGLAGSGKDTVAGMLRAVAQAQCIAFAGPMKEFCREVFGFSVDQLYGPSASRNAPDPRFTRPDGSPLTPRFALQTLGTEWGRNCDPDLWAKAGIRAAQAAERSGALVVITDCRFVNEARLVREAGGHVWLIDRPGVARMPHPSEAEMLTPEFRQHTTRVLTNGGTLEDLEDTVRYVITEDLL